MNIKKFLYFDTETTGKDPEDRICQLAFILNEADTGKRLNAADLFCKPPLPIKVEAMAVHHITNERVEKLEPFSYLVESVKPIFEASDTVCIAHNAPFDLAMLKKEGVEPKNVIDTLKVARFLDSEGAIPSHGLQYLRYFLKLEVGDIPAHDAMCDVVVLMKLFERLAMKMTYEEMIEVSSKPSLIVRFSFGKHKGRKIADVAKSDASYLRWLLDSERQKPDADENMVYTLQTVLA